MPGGPVRRASARPRTGRPEVPCHFCPWKCATRFFLPVDANGKLRFESPLYVVVHRCADCFAAWLLIIPRKGDGHEWFREVSRDEAIVQELMHA